jgi:hypothetical protein
VITREQARELNTRERAAQGLPARIEDVAVLQRIATIMRLARRQHVADPMRRRRKSES